MESRKAKLLTLVIDNYIRAAEPVGSRFLVDKCDLEVSEATVRNELRELEEEGFLTHPHTSAGRTPTAKGYEYYLSCLDLAAVEAKEQEKNTLEEAFEIISDYEAACKNLAKSLVCLSDELVLIAFSPEEIYYTGLSNLFQKPDFSEMKLIVDVSQIFDRCEEYLSDFFDSVNDEPRFFLGDEHPFGEMLSVVSAKFGKRNESLIALIGPMRMDYKKNMRLMKKIKELI